MTEQSEFQAHNQIKKSPPRQSVIVRYYREKEFLQIPENRLIDIIPIIAKARPELSILESWEKHFQNLKIPYCVKEKPGWVQGKVAPVLSLWKERRA